jgi:hypothetical protein
MSSISSVLSALQTDFALIDGTGDYTFNLSTDAIQHRHPGSPTTTPQLRYWIEELSEQDDQPIASLSGLSLRLVVGVALYVDAQADLSDGAERAALALDDLLRWVVRSDQRALGGLSVSIALLDALVSAGAEGRSEPAAFARFELLIPFEPGD